MRKRKLGSNIRPCNALTYTTLFRSHVESCYALCGKGSLVGILDLAVTEKSPPAAAGGPLKKLLAELSPCLKARAPPGAFSKAHPLPRSEEHTSELQSHSDLVCRLLL